MLIIIFFSISTILAYLIKSYFGTKHSNYLREKSDRLEEKLFNSSTASEQKKHTRNLMQSNDIQMKEEMYQGHSSYGMTMKTLRVIATAVIIITARAIPKK